MSRKSLFYRLFSILQITFLLFLLIPNLAAQRNSARKPEAVFSNATPIAINTSPGATLPMKATLYPSTIDVSGTTGTITGLSVTLDGINHRSMADLDFLLVGPTGLKYIFLSDGSATGGSQPADDRIYTFADDAATTFTAGLPPSGTYRPTSGDTGTDTFPSPAPAAPYNQPSAATFASVFGGTSANGTWSLYAVDDTFNNPGSLNSGWSLTVTTSGGGPQTFTNANYSGFDDLTMPSSPYGTPIGVAGLTGVISKLRVTLYGFSHGNASDVDILLVGPNGRGLVLMSDVFVSTVASGVDLTFDDAAPTVVQTPLVTGSYRPTDVASESNGDFFPSPAPLRPYFQNNDPLSSFNGFGPNGEWRLYVVDDSITQSGAIAGGWSLDITTAPAPPPLQPGCSAPTFSPTSFPTGINPTNVAVADFNNDSKPDLAVTNQVTNDVSVLLGNGDGTFAPQLLTTVGSSPYALVAGKFNADGNWDLAVANSASNNVSILLGTGTGTFSAPVNYFVGSNPISIAAGDFNGDAKSDLAVANFGGFFSGSVSILLGTGSGAFTNGTAVRTRSQPAFVAVADLQNDGFNDLVVANFGSDSVSTFAGNGTGRFQLQQNITTGAGPVGVELADLGTDGVADLAVANYNADTLTTCQGVGGGNFGSCSNSAAGGYNPISITSADFVGGGTRSTATAMSGSNTVKVLTSDVSVGQSPNAVKAADFNGDGKPDIVSVNFGSNDVSVLTNNCLAAKGNIFDYNGDRRTDYSVFRPGTTQYYVNSLNSSNPVKQFGRATDKLVAADYDGDLKTDFAVYRPSNGLWFIVNQSVRPIYFVQFGLPSDVPVPGDYDGDGKADIAVWRPSDGNWYIRRSSDNDVRIALFGATGDKPAAADFDGDGKADLAVFRPSTGVWYIQKSSDGQYIITQFGIAEDLTVPGDYDGDGKADIAVWRPSTGAWYVSRSSDGGFVASGWGATGDIPVVGDFEGDGRYDFAVWRPGDDIWYVRKSSDNGASYFQWGIPTDVPVPAAYVR